MLKAIAIDDEQIALEIIKRLSEEVPFIHLTGVFTNGIDGLAYMQKNPVDLVFLDIKMPGISGIDLIKTIAKTPMVVFTTAYSEHAVMSFELDAVDYLLKPFSLIRFLKACNKANELLILRNSLQQSASTLPAVFIKSGYEQIRIELSDVLYAESISNYVKFVLTQQTVVSRLTMAEAESLLPSNAFLRIHRSFIASIKSITKMDKRTVWIRQIELPIGPLYLPEIEKTIVKIK